MIIIAIPQWSTILCLVSVTCSFQTGNTLAAPNAGAHTRPPWEPKPPIPPDEDDDDDTSAASGHYDLVRGTPTPPGLY
ncbi:hypothetical protein CRUP_004372 [Coryphaenoides rupestris]|nr:hypothetical protein CRUP_004372 [Coryphaenoides rupestris]